jgi:hypothetical protein
MCQGSSEQGDSKYDYVIIRIDHTSTVLTEYSMRGRIAIRWRSGLYIIYQLYVMSTYTRTLRTTHNWVRLSLSAIRSSALPLYKAPRPAYVQGMAAYELAI